MATIALSPQASALDSLDRLASSIAAGCEDAGNLKSALVWGWHAVGLLAYVRLLSHRSDFDAWLSDYLVEGEADIAVDRDAHWEGRQRLSNLELVDLLSQVEAPILKPEFYQGWQDRTSRCHALRRKANEVLGWGIDEALQAQLLVLLAAYHRLIRVPAGVNIDTHAVSEALPGLGRLLRALVNSTDPEASTLLARVDAAFPGS